MKHTITKAFDFAYSHRVFTQNLNSELSCHAENRCRQLHGHNAQVVVTLSSSSLDKRGFVLDYTELNFFKQLLDTYFDHKTILGVADPWFDLFRTHIPGYQTYVYLEIEGETLGFVRYDSALDTSEFWSSFIVTPFIPTSENLSKFFAKILKKKFPGFDVAVSFSESPKTTATYEV